MTEKLYKARPNGAAALLGILLMYIAAGCLLIVGANISRLLVALAIIVLMSIFAKECTRGTTITITTTISF